MGDISVNLATEPNQQQVVHARFSESGATDWAEVERRAEAALTRAIENNQGLVNGTPTGQFRIIADAPGCWFWRCSERRNVTIPSVWSTSATDAIARHRRPIDPTVNGQTITAPTPAFTPQSSLLDYLRATLVAADTWIDLRPAGQRRGNGIYERLARRPELANFADYENYLAHPENTIAQNNIVLGWVQGRERNPIILPHLDNEALAQQMERYLDLVPDQPGTQREHVRTILTPALGTWVRVIGGDVPGQVVHSRAAVAFHNLRKLFQLAQTAEGTAILIQRVQPVITHAITAHQRRIQEHGRAPEAGSYAEYLDQLGEYFMSMQQANQPIWRSPDTDPAHLSLDEAHNVLNYVLFYGLEPRDTPPQPAWRIRPATRPQNSDAGVNAEPILAREMLFAMVRTYQTFVYTYCQATNNNMGAH